MSSTCLSSKELPRISPNAHVPYTPRRLHVHREDKLRLRTQLATSQAAIDFLSELVHAVRGGIKELVLTGDLAQFIKSLAASLKPVLGGSVDCSHEVRSPRVPSLVHIVHGCCLACSAHATR